LIFYQNLHTSILILATKHPSISMVIYWYFFDNQSK